MSALLDSEFTFINEEGDALKAFQDFCRAQPRGKKINPKKVRNFANKIAPQCKPHIVNGLIRNVLKIKDPVAYLESCFQQIDEYATIIRDMVESGHHGMIQVGNNCYPIKLKAPASWLDPKDPWHPEDERLIGADACSTWMKDNNKGYFHGRAVLFTHYGFSGIPREFEMQCAKDTSKMERYPGTRYFFS